MERKVYKATAVLNFPFYNLNKLRQLRQLRRLRTAPAPKLLARNEHSDFATAREDEKKRRALTIEERPGDDARIPMASRLWIDRRKENGNTTTQQLSTHDIPKPQHSPTARGRNKSAALPLSHQQQRPCSTVNKLLHICRSCSEHERPWKYT